MCTELRVTTREEPDAFSLAAPNGLKVALQIPSADNACVKTVSPAAQAIADLRRITARECRDVRVIGDVLQPVKRVPFKKGHVPLEVDPEARCSLPGRILPVTEEHFEI